MRSQSWKKATLTMRIWVCTSSRRECLKTRAKCGAFPPWQQPLMTSILWQKWLSMPGEWYVIQASARFDATHAPRMQEPITVRNHSAYIRSGHSSNSFSIPKSWGFFEKLLSGVLSTKNSELLWSVFFFRFWAPNSDRFFGLTQANFEANSANFTQLTQNFGYSKQKNS